MDAVSQKRIELLKQYISEDSEDIFSKYALALEFVKQKKSTDAVSLLLDIIKNHPDYLAAYYQLGKLYEHEGSAIEARKMYELGKAIAQQQKDFKTLNELNAAIDTLEE